MKGRANYLCRQKLYDAEREPILTGLAEISEFRLIRDWEKMTATGDRSELRELPEVEQQLVEARCPRRCLQRPEVPAIRALLHHRNA